MCYSALVWADYHRYVRKFGAELGIKDFVRLYVERAGGAAVKTPKAMDAALAGLEGVDGEAIRNAIAAHEAAQAAGLEQLLFAQKTRLVAAERSLQAKATKKALEDQRIAGNKIAWAKKKLADLRRTELRPGDSRIFPGMYAPVLVSEGGRRVLRPMRYQCRPAGKPASYDRRYPGTYNARRDNLEGFWKGHFGHHHGLLVATTFYENVEAEGGGNRVLEFTPRTGEPMLIACLWSHWQGKDGELLSFAAITDEPEPEVAAAGHDRTIINLKPEHVDAWLNPDPADLGALYSIFDDRQHPYYEHRMAA
jgi:putative SOS response-associated peptidase YedK